MLHANDSKGVEALIRDAKTRADHYHALIRYDIDHYMKRMNLKRIGENLKISGMRLMADKRTYFVAGGIIVSYVIIRLLSRRRKSRKIEAPATGVVTLRTSKPSLLTTLAVEAMKLFLLHYMRKLLTEYLEKNQKS
jgi:hypothetical protein